MAIKGYVLSEAGYIELKAAVAELNRLVANTRNRAGIDWVEHQAPEVYIALTPAEGIPGATRLGAGTGTGTSDDGELSPGWALCDIYRLTLSHTDGTPSLLLVDGVSKRVYNLATSAIPSSTYVVVWRDKFGDWLAGGSAGDSTRLMRLTDKLFPAGGYIQYSWVLVLDSDSIAWLEQPEVGGPGNFPAFEANNHDCVVSLEGSPSDTGTGTDTQEDDRPTVVRAWRGMGDYYLFHHTPPWEFNERVSDFDAEGYAEAWRIRWDQESDTWIRVERTYIIDANAQ